MVMKKLMSVLLNIQQKLINRLYEKEGLTDSVLEYQLKVNEYRAKYDIPDSSMLNDDGFCQ